MSPLPRSLFVDITSETAGHLVVACRLLRDQYRRDGMRVPEDIEALVQVLASRAMSGQGGTPVDALAAPIDSAPVPRRLLRLQEAAEALACSERTVKRLVGDGRLPAVHPGEGSTRIRVSDLDAYVEALNDSEESAC